MNIQEMKEKKKEKEAIKREIEKELEEKRRAEEERQKQEIIKKNYIYTCFEWTFQLIQIQHNMNIKIRSIYTRHFYDKNKAEKGQKRPDSSC